MRGCHTAVRFITTIVFLGLLVSASGARMIPPLPSDRRQAVERAPLDLISPQALRPLLVDAWSWPPGAEGGAAVPDLDALIAEPAATRGDLMLVEGLFAGTLVDPMSPLPESSSVAAEGLAMPWDSSLRGWRVVLDDRGTEDSADDLEALWLLVDPGPPPPLDTPVRGAGRFFGLWTAPDPTLPPVVNPDDSDAPLAPATRTRLVFVGRDARESEVRRNVAYATDELGDAAQAVLREVDDFTRGFDGPGLYPLLEAASDSIPVPGARLPDYDLLLTEPGRRRGDRFVIEGRFPGLPPDDNDATLVYERSGPWDGRMQQWPILIDRRDPDDPTDDLVAVAIVVDAAEPPRLGAPVRLIGRFYKTWSQVNLAGESRHYPVFVGRVLDARGGGYSPGGGAGAAAGALPFAVLAGLVLLGLVWFRLRRATPARRGGARPRRGRDVAGGVASSRRASDGSEELEQDEQGPPLPENPVDALAELEVRRTTGPG